MWATDLAKMGIFYIIIIYVIYLLCVTDVFTKYAWVKTLKDKKVKTVLNALVETRNESNRKPNYGLIKEENFTINLCQNG